MNPPLPANRLLVSFVIPTKEEEGYIGALLRNLRTASEQSGLPVETIVVDSRSADRTVAEAAGLADHVITDCDLACASIAHARNIGARFATGEFLFHTDADVLVPDLAGLLGRVAREFADPETVAVTARVMPYPWEATWRDDVIHRIANAFFRSSRRYGSRFSRGECQIVRRSAFEAVGGYTGRFISGEDCDLFHRLHRVGRVIYLKDQQVYHSLRRFRHDGYVRTLGVYVREWLWMSLLDRSFVTEWRPVR
jgi:glycosyltransferase involved in cell wall biosynthesis